MTWSSDIEQASFAGVPFEVRSTDDTLERRVARYAIPWVDGADLDDLGREPTAVRVAAVFNGPDYRDRLQALRQATDAGEQGDFVHPILGGGRYRIVRLVVHHECTARDHAEAELELLEDGTRTTLADLQSVGALEAEVLTRASLASSANTALTEPVEEADAAVEAAEDFATGGADAVDSVDRQVDAVRSQIDTAVAAAGAAGDLVAQPLVHALRLLGHSCLQLSRRVQQQRPQVMIKEVTTTQPLSTLAHTLYGDAEREADLLELNRIRNPFMVPAGSQVKVHDR